jgi:hypothetical protein
VGKEIGELEVVQELVHSHQLSQMEGMSQFCQAVKWKDETDSSYCRTVKDMLAWLA